MKQPLAILLLLLSFVSAQETIAVIEFEAKGISQLEASALTDELEIKLSDIGGYIVVERGRAQEILNEQAFQQTGCVSSECAVEVGKILSVQKIVLGSITIVGSTFSVNAKIVDVETGKIIKTANYKYRGQIDDLLVSGMAEVALTLSSGDTAIKSESPPEPKLGNVRFVSSLDSVEVLVNDEFLGHTPLIIQKMEADVNHEVVGRKKGFRENSRSFVLKRGETSEIPIELTRRRGTISVIPVREGQRFDLFVGDQSFKGINGKKLDLIEGIYPIKIQEHGYYDILDTIRIIDQSMGTTNADNKPILVPIKFNIYPNNSLVSVNGNSVNSQDMMDYRLPYGTYKFVGMAPQYDPFRTQFEIRNNQPLTVEFRLNPKSRKRAFLKSLIIPGSGQIYAENKERGLLFLGSALTSGFLLYSASATYSNEDALLNQYRSDYQNAVTLNDIDNSLSLYDAQTVKVNDLQNKLLMYGVSLGVTWVVNLIDAYFFQSLTSD